MTIFDSVKSFFKRSVQTLNLTVKSMPMRVAWLSAEYWKVTWDSIVKFGLKENSAVYSLVSLLVDTANEPSYKLFRKDNGQKIEVLEGELAELLDRPNSFQSHAQFMDLVYSMLFVGGGVYIWKERDGNSGKVVGLYPFSVGQITPQPGVTTSDGFVKNYLLSVGDEKIPISTDDMFHIYLFTNPQSPHLPISPIEAAAKQIDLDNELTNYTFSSLKNGAVPGVIIQSAPDEIVTKEVADRLRQEWLSTFGGEKRGSVAFLQSGMKAEVIGAKLGEINVSAIHKVPEARLAAVFRVPPMLAGLSVGLDASTYSNFESAIKVLTKLTLMPLWSMMGDIITFHILPEFGIPSRQFEISVDLREVSILADDQDKIWERAMRGFSGGLITRAQAKTIIGIEVDETDDVYYIPSNIMIVSADMQSTPVLDAITARLQGQSGGGNKPAGKDGGKSEEVEKKSPPCRLFDESVDECVARKIPELVAEGMEQEQAVAAAYEICNESCGSDRKDSPLPDGLSTKISHGEILNVVNLMRSLRLSAAYKLENEIQKYYNSLGDTILNRILTGGKSMGTKATKLPLVEDILKEEDNKLLAELLNTHFKQLAYTTWGLENLLLGANIDFSDNDPALVSIAQFSSERVVQINETTRKALKDLLELAAEEGWSIDHLIRGDPKRGIKGIKDTVIETYRRRSRTIARTELGWMQNSSTGLRYKNLGVEKVLIFDGGDTDSDEQCNALNNTVQTLEWFLENPLDHPNCVRSAGPIFEE